MSNPLKAAKALTKAQRRVLQSVADDAVLMMFDVYGGYSWYERAARLPSYGGGKSDAWPPLPIRYLLEKELIYRDDVEHVASGTQAYRYVITDLGPALLSGEPQ